MVGVWLGSYIKIDFEYCQIVCGHCQELALANARAGVRYFWC